MKAKGVQSGTSKVILIKWPVSVCVYIYKIQFYNLINLFCSVSLDLPFI